MKGLLLKDLYMMRYYCRSYLLITLVFFAVSFVNSENLFFVFYPCLLCGMIPVNLLSYDERSRFVRYSATLPYTRAQVVSAKYLLGLFTQLAVLILTGIVQGIRMRINGTFIPGDFAVMILAILIVSTMSSSIPLPFIFKYGAEKGRLAYYVMIGFVCAAGALFSELFKGKFQNGSSSGTLFLLLSVIAICVYILSWYLSTMFYQKREL